MGKHIDKMLGFSGVTAGRAQLAAFAVAGAMALASPAAADPFGTALVESVSSVSAGVELMDYVRTGQTIRLASGETIVLSYMSSCLREAITGGTVIIGTDRSEVHAGDVKRTRVPCDVGQFVLTGGFNQVGGRAFRGVGH